MQAFFEDPSSARLADCLAEIEESPGTKSELVRFYDALEQQLCYDHQNEELVKAREKVMDRLTKSTFVNMVDEASGEETTIDGDNKMESIKATMRDQEKRLREDFEMFRDVIKEENMLVRDRMSSYGTLQGTRLLVGGRGLVTEPNRRRYQRHHWAFFDHLVNCWWL